MSQISIETEKKDLIKATHAAAEYFTRYDIKKLRLSESFFLMIHKILLAHKPKDAGKYRTARNTLKILGKTFNPSPAWKVKMDVVDLVGFINNRHTWGPKYRKYIIKQVSNAQSLKSNRIIYGIFIAWYIHHKFVVIHPFNDGNGRIARLLMCLILAFEDLSNISYPVLINEMIRKDKYKYLDCLNAADRGNYVAGTEYMIALLSKAYSLTVKETKLILKN